MSENGSGLRAELIERFHNPEPRLDDDAFNGLALRVFGRNYAEVAPYQAYCRARGRTPETVTNWQQIPAVPTGAFKELTLLARDRTAERVFRTSGTSRGADRRGAHHVADLDLYRASLRPTFRHFLLPDGITPRCVSLMPAATQMPDSSLAFMVEDVMATFGTEDSQTFATTEEIDYVALERAMETAERSPIPVLLLGTTAAFVHWLDRLDERGRFFELPSGSRLMDTGGFKGRGRDIDPSALRWRYREHLGIPAHACVNEYGMTELLSQRYDTVLRDRFVDGSVATAEARPKGGPPWLRTVAVDPESLEPFGAGERGLLRHVDLANLDSVVAIQTEDLGWIDERGCVVVEGRVKGAPPRGCSTAMDDLLGDGP